MKKILFFILFVLASHVMAVAQWVQCKGPYGGDIRCVSQSSSRSATVFAGLETGGIYRSTDNGDTWVAVNKGITYQNGSTAVTSIVEKNNTLFIDTYNALYRSRDNGDHWQEITTGLSGHSTSIAVAGSMLFACTDVGLFRSTDSGDSWTKINSEIYQTLTAQGTTLYATMENGQGLLRSMDGGVTWINSSTGIVGKQITAFAVDSNLAFASTEKGLFRSTDNGDTWSKVEELEKRYSVLSIYSLAINGATVFVGTQGDGIIRSTDKGDHWSKVNTGLYRSTPSSEYFLMVMALAYNGTTLFAGHQLAGVYRSTNNGDNWKDVNVGITSNIIKGLGATKTSLFGFSRLHGIVRTDDKGDTWTPAAKGMLFPEVTCFTALYDSLFVWDGNILYTSGDNGDTWEVEFDNLSGGVYSVVQCGAMLFAGTTFGIFQSTGFGASWEPVTTGSYLNPLLAVQISTLYALTSNGLQRSSDYGKTWVNINNNLPNNEIRTIVTTSGALFAALSGAGIYRSTDQGDHWTAVTSGLQGKNVVCLIAQGATLFAGTSDGGVFRSSDNGTTWNAKNTTFMTSSVVSMAVVGTSLFVSTSSEGVFRGEVTDFTTDVEEQPASPSSSIRISPQPVNGDYLTISNIPASSSELRIYSLLGEIVHSEALNGTERRQMNVSGLPAGVYYLRVGMETRMVIKQ